MIIAFQHNLKQKLPKEISQAKSLGNDIAGISCWFNVATILIKQESRLFGNAAYRIIMPPWPNR